MRNAALLAYGVTLFFAPGVAKFPDKPASGAVETAQFPATSAPFESLRSNECALLAVDFFLNLNQRLVKLMVALCKRSGYLYLQVLLRPGLDFQSFQ